MKTNLILLAAAIASALAGLALAGAPTASAKPEQIERGRYLVHNVGMCIDCHSPRGPDGRFIESKHLTGDTLPFAATVPMPWAPVAPNLAGLPASYSAEDMTRFLMTGERPHGLPATLPPMPAIRLNQEDAEAITAYLVSLAPSS